MYIIKVILNIIVLLVLTCVIFDEQKTSVHEQFNPSSLKITVIE